jgi:hypothetical protein
MQVQPPGLTPPATNSSYTLLRERMSQPALVDAPCEYDALGRKYPESERYLRPSSSGGEPFMGGANPSGQPLKVLASPTDYMMGRVASKLKTARSMGLEWPNLCLILVEARDSPHRFDVMLQSISSPRPEGPSPHHPDVPQSRNAVTRTILQLHSISFSYRRYLGSYRRSPSAGP